jgi:predicted cobalt transporter CbtA
VTELKTLTFIAITLLAGAIAGAILATINQGIVEPYIDAAIDIENQNAIAAGELFDPTEYANYRIWQKGGEIAAGTILGMSLGSLFGIVFAYARPSIPGSNNKKKALIVAGIMWLVLFLIPALKYPANPPAVGDPETIYYRQTLYIAFLAVSGFSALGLAFVYRKMGSMQSKKILVPGVYAAIMIAAFVGMPPNPDEITAPMDLVNTFRVASAFTMSLFWAMLGLILGAFWDRLKPHETARIRVA